MCQGVVEAPKKVPNPAWDENEEDNEGRLLGGGKTLMYIPR